MGRVATATEMTRPATDVLMVSSVYLKQMVHRTKYSKRIVKLKTLSQKEGSDQKACVCRDSLFEVFRRQFAALSLFEI